MQKQRHRLGHTAINQKAASIAAEMVVEAVAIAADMAAAKMLVEGVVTIWTLTALATMGQAMAGADNTQAKSDRNGSCGGGNGNSHDCNDGCGRDEGSDGGDNGGANSGGGSSQAAAMTAAMAAAKTQ